MFDSNACTGRDRFSSLNTPGQYKRAILSACSSPYTMDVITTEARLYELWHGRRGKHAAEQSCCLLHMSYEWHMFNQTYSPFIREMSSQQGISNNLAAWFLNKPIMPRWRPMPMRLVWNELWDDTTRQCVLDQSFRWVMRAMMSRWRVAYAQIILQIVYKLWRHTVR